METQTDICQDILDDFLNRWTVDNIKRMTLDQYVSVGNKDTFCQWLETRTRGLGSIKGINSSKFGIYKRGDKTKKPKKLANDHDYSWQKFYSVSNDRSEAFENIRREILQIIKFADNGQFENIDNLHLTQFVRWKIAYLYSNERLIPIFKKDVLIKIAKFYGLNADYHTPNSAIQKIMISNKPAHLSIYEYSEELYEKFGRDKKKTVNKKDSTTRTNRRAAIERNMQMQARRGSSSYIATQKHNVLQEVLKKKLVAKYGEENVLLEKNFVDIKVLQPDKIYFYEVKSSAFAANCIKEALGQILFYTHQDTDKRPKRLIVAGQYQPNENEIDFIKYIKKSLNIHFEYEHVDLN